MLYTYCLFLFSYIQWISSCTYSTFQKSHFLQINCFKRSSMLKVLSNCIYSCIIRFCGISHCSENILAANWTKAYFQSMCLNDFCSFESVTVQLWVCVQGWRVKSFTGCLDIRIIWALGYFQGCVGRCWFCSGLGKTNLQWSCSEVAGYFLGLCKI